MTTVAIVAIGGIIPYTPVGTMLGFVPLPPLYWVCVTAMMLAYAALGDVGGVLSLESQEWRIAPGPNMIAPPQDT